MDQPDLDNKTEFAAHPQMLLDVDGEKLVTIVKASFEIENGADGCKLELAPLARNRGIRMADVPWGEPDISSIAYPADLCLRKPGTDVIVVGCGHAPGGEPVPSFDVRVQVGAIAKSLVVFGTRVWKSSSELTDAMPVSEMQLRYEYAWGGFDDSDPENIVEEPRNPIGMGRVADPDVLVGQGGPNIEDPGHLIGAYETDPAPAGIGAIGRHWEPRRKYAGTYDDSWTESRAPLPPTDIDDRFNLCAAAGMTSTKPLEGGEEVGLLNLLPGGGATQFRLPKIEVQIEYRVKGRERVTLLPYLDTVLIDLLMTGPEKPPAVELVWRASVSAPRNMNDVKIIVRERDLP